MTSRLIARLAAALPLLLLVSGCGGSAAADRAAGPSTAFDRALHGALPAEIRDGGVLRVATDASYAPASSFAADGRTIVGFEPDLGAALGRVLGVEVRFGQAKFSELLSDVVTARTS